MNTNTLKIAIAIALGGSLVVPASAQETELEEIIVTGSQIRGASISDALPVSVIDVGDIEALGIDSGDELLDALAENGQNFVNEAENIGGGVNAARGDTGAFNLRNLGTGNTLVLVNGRRMVNEPAYQTEEVGGSFVPVNSVNSNTVPVYGVQRVEILRDGASAIYGADAVAGVVNTVLKNNFDGFKARIKLSSYDHVPRNDQSVALEWGSLFNEGRSSLGVYFDYLSRDRVNSQDEARWADADFRGRVPTGSPWEGDTRFRNNSANGLFGQFDVIASASGAGLSGPITDSRGEFEVFPSGSPECEWELGYGNCGAPDGNGTVRYNLNENRDLVSELERMNLFLNFSHEFDNGVEAYSELAFYSSDTNLNRHPSASFSTVKLRVAADNFYNPFGPCGSPNRLDDSIIGTDVPCEGLELELDNYRFAEVPRIINNEATTVRVLQGVRGEFGEWDYDGAVVWSKATRDDVTSNRVSNILMQEALNDNTSAAYNPFSAGVDSNIERALIDVSRLNETELTMVDFKVSRNSIYNLPAGPVAALLGFEFRNESFLDDRDDRLDGTIVFTDNQGDTFPFVSDVVNSSPSPDSSGDRDVTSLFGELQIPVMDNLDVQVALRYENFSDVGNTTVGKVAAGWRPVPNLLFRGSWSEAFRAPNLVTVNESFVARQNTRTDFACQYAADNGGDPNQNIIDCVNSIQRTAEGSQDLVAEESDNTSIGIVYEPTDYLTFTLDYWSIKKENTIGLFGEENHTILDLVNRINAGTANCGSFQGNPAVVRDDDLDTDQEAVYLAAGICPAGDIDVINDRYANLDTRTVQGHDIGVYYDIETDLGRFNVRYVASFLDRYEQEAGGDAALLVQAQNSGLLPGSIPVDGFDDLRRRDGNPDNKHTLRANWRKGNYGATLSGLHIGSFYQSSLTLDDGTRYDVPSMTTWNASVDYRFDVSNFNSRVRFGVNNLSDARAPLADRFFGYFADVHRDLGRYYYLELRVGR
ncbi:MAG: TonB-dependent receptor [Gammaproteobacteria bacterium]